jgi:hypothetical protein
MKACSIGLHNLVKKTLDNKPYFSYKENDNFGTITILDSYTKKINIKNSMGIAGTVATSINTAINNGYKNIGKVAFIGRDNYNRGIVNIKATDNQLNLINAIDNSKEADELQKEVDKEREIEEEKALRESRSQEIEENREYFENDEPFTRASVDEKPIPDTGIQGTLFQETGRSLQELDNLPEKEIENLQSTVEYQILNEQEEEDLTIKGGQSYVFLNKRDAERFSVLLNREGEFPKEFRVEKKVTRYKKDSEVKGKFNAFNEYVDYYYSKVNNNKKSNLYHIINEKTGDVIAENVRVLHVSKDVKKGISEKYGLEFTPTKVFSANRSIEFTLYRLKPSKNKYVAQAKKYLYDALKFLNPEEANLKINLDKIEGFLESFPKDMWDYINTTYSPEDSTNINASISLQNEIKFELPKLGFLQEVEKITGIPLQGVSFKNYDRTGSLAKVFKYSKLNGEWGETITIDSSMTTKELKASIKYYLKSKNYFNPTSSEENVRKYAEHKNIDYNELRELVFGDIDKALDNISYNNTGNSDTIELSKWRESVREYDWQSVELFSKPYENFQNTVKKRITEKFKDKELSNGISHLDYFFNSGAFNWLNINFNNISGQYYMSDMETEADTGFDVKMVGFANPFELKTYKKPKPGKNFLEEKEVFNRLAAILHEPFHALHALSYGTEEELQLRKAFDNLYNTNFGREMMNQVFGSGYNQGQQISYDTLYKEFTAFATQLMLYPKEWITKTDLRSNDIYDFIEKVQTLQDKTYEEIVRTQQKIGTTEKTITEEEQIKLTFLEKLYNYLVSALNKIIPLSKKFFDVIADSKLVEKTVIEDVFGETEETVTKTLKLPENIKKAKEEFLSSMEDLKSAINTLMQIDSKLFSPDNINKFFNKDQFNQEPGRAEKPTIKPGVQELFESNPELANEVYSALGFRQTVVTEIATAFKDPSKFSKEDYDALEDMGYTEDEILDKLGAKKSETVLTKTLVTPQQKQQAISVYSQYLQQNPNGNVEQFKSWVEEFNKNNRTPLTPTTEQLKHIKPLPEKLIEQVNSWINKPNKDILNTLKLYAEVYAKDKELENLIQILIDNVDKIKFVKFKGIGKLQNNNHQAEYDGETGEIFVNNIMYQPNNRDVEDRLYRTIIHEYLHGYFLSVLDSPKTEQEKQLVEYINEAYDVLTFEYEGTDKWYGFHDVDEFVSELLSNKEFRESEQVRKTGIVQKILNFINQIFFKKYGKNSIEIKQNTFNKLLENISILEPSLIKYADIKGSLSDFISQKSQERLNTIESYRAQEQAELSQRIPNIENYKVNGKVDKSLITDENDLETYNEIYDKYDALITPLLEASEETKEQPEDILKTYEEDLEQNTEDLEDTEDTSNINEDDDFLEEDFPVEEKENKPNVEYTFNEEFELLNRKLISLGLNTLSLEDYDNFTNIQKEIIKSCYGI